MNFKITHILTPVDFSEASLQVADHAVLMAKIFGAKLSLINAVHSLKYTDEFDSAVAPDEKFSFVMRKKLDNLANSAHENHGIPKPEVIICGGDIVDALIKTSEEIKPDIIVMGTHGVSGWEEFFVGSHAYSVIKKAHCPVLTIQKHTAEKGFKKIVLPIDNSYPTRQKVVHAIEFAKQCDAVVHVVGLVSHDLPEVHHKIHIMLKQVNQFLHKHDILYENKIITGSNIATMSMNYAKEIDADLIMVMTEQEDHLGEIIDGSYGQQIVNHSQIPVLSIMPAPVLYSAASFPY